MVTRIVSDLYLKSILEACFKCSFHATRQKGTSTHQISHWKEARVLLRLEFRLDRGYGGLDILGRR